MNRHERRVLGSGRSARDRDRIEEGRGYARLFMREFFARTDFGTSVLVLAHASARRVYDSVLEQGGQDPDGCGWAMNIGDRCNLPAHASIAADMLPVLISAGKLNLLTGIARDDVVSAPDGAP